MLVNSGKIEILRMTNTFAALGNRDYRLFWGANFSMYISRWMQMTTLSWFVLERTNSAFNVGLIGFFGMVPFLVLGVFGGFLADNLNKKRLIIITHQLTGPKGSFSKCDVSDLNNKS